jgi:hypothetical protein
MIYFEMNNKLGVVSTRDNEVHSIVSIIKSHEQTRKIVYDESKENKELLQPQNHDLFTQVT